MKTLRLTLLAIATLGLVAAHAQDDGSLPFPVSVGGQAATYKKGEAFARIAKPVKADAAIVIDAKAEGMIIINANKTDEKGTPTPGAQPAVILLQGTNKGTLAGTMDKQKLAAGNYVLSVVADGKTASILFQVE